MRKLSSIVILALIAWFFAYGAVLAALDIMEMFR